MRFAIERSDEKKIKVLTRVDWKRYLQPYDRRQSVLTFESFSVEWLVPPEVAKQLEPGTYELTATVKGITSEPVRFVVKQPRSKADEAEVASSLCSFHVKRGAYDEAIRVATAALSASLGNPDSFHS